MKLTEGGTGVIEIGILEIKEMEDDVGRRTWDAFG